MRLLALLMLLLVSFTPAMADEASHRAAVEELLAAARVDRITDTYLRIIQNSFQQGFRQAGGTVQHQAIFEKHWSQVSEIVRRQMAWEQIKGDMIDIYADAFTEEEVRELLAFYDTPVGQKSLDVMPQLMQRGGEMGQRRMEEVQPEIQQIANAMIRELREGK